MQRLEICCVGSLMASLQSMPNAATAGRSNFLLQKWRSRAVGVRSEWPKIAVARGRSTIKFIRFGSDRSEWREAYGGTGRSKKEPKSNQ